MYFCPKCSYSFDVTKSITDNDEDKEEISSINMLIKKVNKNESLNNIKLVLTKQNIINDEKFKKLKETKQNKILNLFKNNSSTIMFNCLNCNHKMQINETIRLYHLDLQSETSNELSFDHCKILSEDPILPRTKDYSCKNINCITHKNTSKKEAIFFKDNTTYKLNYICCVCHTNWN